MGREAQKFKKTKANDRFTENISTKHPVIFKLLKGELDRQQNSIELIASENIVSANVLAAFRLGALTNKYAEGYPGNRYYGGCEVVDKIEQIAIDSAKQLFNCQDKEGKAVECKYANVQPHSGAQANEAVYAAFLNTGDKILGMNLNEGGHLSHGSPMNSSGKLYNVVSYGVDKTTGRIDYDKLEEKALEELPKLIVAGASAYSRQIDFKRFREITDKVTAKLKEKGADHKCYLMVDMAHYAGLVAGGVYDSPIPYADVVTSTTHKTLRGPRGGLILAKDEALKLPVYKKNPETGKFELDREEKDDVEKGKKKGDIKMKSLRLAINSAVFPGIQGGPLMHVIAAKAVAFQEALRPDFKDYAQQVKDNAEMLSNTLKSRGIDIVSDGTDSHLILLDLRSKNATDAVITGDVFEKVLEHAGLTANKNLVPGDPQKPLVTSGIRLGSPAATSRGFGTAEFEKIGGWIADLLIAARSAEISSPEILAETSDDKRKEKIKKAVEAKTGELEKSIRSKVQDLCAEHPIYEDMRRQMDKSMGLAA